MSIRIASTLPRGCEGNRSLEDSVLRTEMTGLESQEEDDPKCILFFKTMS